MTRGQGQLIWSCLKEGVGGCSVEGMGGVGRYVLAELRPEGTSDRNICGT